MTLLLLISVLILTNLPVVLQKSCDKPIVKFSHNIYLLLSLTMQGTNLTIR